jgi:tRNA dimethylallyltransferase
MKPNVIVICGPTALGKTATAIELAEIFNGEIVGADSMQIYRDMNIGTAKPSPQELARVRHHLIDIADPDQHFDAKQYAQTAHTKIVELVSQAIVPFVVGGTGLYIKALVHGLFMAESANDDLRTRLKEEAQSHDTEFLYERLNRCDPDAAARIKPHDSYRIVRALEIYQLTGKTISAYHHEHRFKDEPFRVLKIGLNMERELLYDRINQRVDAMIAAGLVDEVKALLGRGYAPDLKSMRSIGYRHMVDFIKEHLSWHEAVRTLKRDTRRYAKRQLTWFKADSDIAWYTPGQLSDISRSIKKFLHLP